MSSRVGGALNEARRIRTHDDVVVSEVVIVSVVVVGVEVLLICLKLQEEEVRVSERTAKGEGEQIARAQRLEPQEIERSSPPSQDEHLASQGISRRIGLALLGFCPSLSARRREEEEGQRVEGRNGAEVVVRG